jgi:hypothetical protein
MPSPVDPRRDLFGAAAKYLLESAPAPVPPAPVVAPRLTLAALEQIPMSRSRARILENLESAFDEVYQKAKVENDPLKLESLQFAYTRDQLYFEILLDIRDALERRG